MEKKRVAKKLLAEDESESQRESVCVKGRDVMCLCVMRMCVCVCEREREREKESDTCFMRKRGIVVKKLHHEHFVFMFSWMVFRLVRFIRLSF